MASSAIRFSTRSSTRRILACRDTWLTILMLLTYPAARPGWPGAIVSRSGQVVPPPAVRILARPRPSPLPPAPVRPAPVRYSRLLPRRLRPARLLLRYLASWRLALRRLRLGAHRSRAH